MPKPSHRPAKRVTMLFYLFPDQRKVLKVFAAQKELSIQGLIRLSLDEYISRNGGKAVFK